MNKVYAFKNTYDEVMKSSSGGAFIALCQTFEKCFGTGNVMFYGAAFDEELNVVHKNVSTAEECDIFKGSKYVKSSCKEAFYNVISNLQEGKNILFSGTPCQIRALKQFLEKNNIDDSNVFYIDIICHGTPRTRVWTDYKNWLEKKAGARLVKYSFRYKPEGWKAYPVYAEFKNGKTLINTAETSVYSKLYMRRLSITKNCFECQFSSIKRISDITLGDYWGIEAVFPDIDSKNGVSLILANSDKGQQLIEKMDNPKWEKIETKDRSFIKYQSNLNHPTEKPLNYEEFWKLYDEKGFEYIIKEYAGFDSKYKFEHRIKKLVRKTPVINLYRKRKNR